MYRRGIIEKVVEATPKVKVYSIRLFEKINANPGQYLMLWVPRVGEIPLSIANLEEDELLLVIARKGRVTTHIHKTFKSGLKIFFRGPLGRGFTIKKGGSLLVGGGYGLAPLYFLAKRIIKLNSHCDAILGFKTARDAFFIEEFRKTCRLVYVSTDDGSLGYKGTVIDLLKQMRLSYYKAVYAVGPEPMIAKVTKICFKRDVYLEASLERLIRCGRGVCGSCVLDPLGLRVCKDGPVFSIKELMKIKDLNKYHRDFTGKKVPIEEPLVL